MANEEIEIYGSRHHAQSAWAWRRKPDVPDWRVYVILGDGGYECDPGVYGEPVGVAIEEVSKAIATLSEMLVALKKLEADE